MSFSLNHRKLYLQTFQKINMLLGINREIRKTKKFRFRFMVKKKIESEIENIAAISKNTSQEKGKAVSHGPMA